MTKHRIKKILLSVAGGLLLFALALILFIRLSGPEWVTIQIARNIAREAGFTEFSVERIEIDPDGKVRLAGLFLSGVPQDASQAIRLMSLRISNATASLEWQGFFRSENPGEAAPLSAYIPPPMKDLEIGEVRVNMDMWDGSYAEILIPRIDFRRTGREDARLTASLSAQYATQEKSWQGKLETAIEIAGRDLLLNVIQADLPWGNVHIQGRVPNTYRFVSETSEAVAQIAASTDEMEMRRNLETFLRSKEWKGLELLAKFERADDPEELPLDPEWSARLPGYASISLQGDPEGVHLNTEIDEGAFSGPPIEAQWSRMTLTYTNGRWRLGPLKIRVNRVLTEKILSNPLEFRAEGNLFEPGAPVWITLGTGLPLDFGQLAETTALTNPPLPAKIIGNTSGEIELRGTLLPLGLEKATGTITADLVFESTHFSESIPLFADLEFNLDAERARIQSRGLRLAGGELFFEGEVRFSDWEPTHYQAEFTIEAFPLHPGMPFASLLPVKALGTLTARGHIEAPTPELASAVAEVSLVARMENIEFEKRSTGPLSLETEVTWTGAGLEVSRLDLEAFAGILSATGHWAGPEEPASARFLAQLTLPDLDALSPAVPELPFPIGGALTLSLGGDLKPGLSGTVELNLEAHDLRAEGYPMLETLRMEARYENETVHVTRLILQTMDTDAGFMGTVGLDGSLAGRIHLTLGRALGETLLALWEPPPEELKDLALEEEMRVGVNGNIGGTIESPSVELDLASSGIAFRDVRLDGLNMKAASNGNETLISDLRLLLGKVGHDPEISPAEIIGTGRFLLDETPLADAHFTIENLDLSLASAWMPESVPLEGNLTGHLGGRFHKGLESLDVGLVLKNLHVVGQKLDELTFDAHARDGDLTAYLRAGNVYEGTLSATAAIERIGQARLHLEMDDLEISNIPILSGTASGLANARLASSIPLSENFLKTFEFRLDDSLPGLELSAKVTLDSATAAGFHLGNFILEATGAERKARAVLTSSSPALGLRADGELDTRRVHLNGNWNELDLGAYLPKAEIPLGAMHTGSLNVFWEQGKPIHGSLFSKEMVIDLGEDRFVQKSPASIHFDETIIRLEPLTLNHTRYPSMQVSAAGTIQLGAGTEETDLLIRLDEFSLDQLDLKGLESIRDVEGLLQGEVRMRGSLEKPMLLGEIHLSRGRLSLPEFSRAISDIEMTARLEGETIMMDSLTARLGKGIIGAKAEVGFSPDGPPHIEARIGFRNVRFSEIEDLSLETDGDLSISGPVDSATVTGTVIVTRGSFTRMVDWTTFVMAYLDARTVGPAEPPPINPYLDIRLLVPDNFWVRNSIISAELSADVRLIGRLEQPSLTGRANVEKGVLQVNFGRFTIRRAATLFDESRPFVPYLLVEGESRMRGYLIRVHISGDPDSIDLHWSSSPPLTEQEIVNLLTTGSPRAPESGSQSAGAAFILSQGLRYSASESLSEALPVDTIELQPTATTEGGVGAEVVAGKQITDRLTFKQYVSIDDPSNPALGAEYKLTERFSLASRASRGNTYILELIYELLF